MHDVGALKAFLYRHPGDTTTEITATARTFYCRGVLLPPPSILTGGHLVVRSGDPVGGAPKPHPGPHHGVLLLGGGGPSLPWGLPARRRGGAPMWPGGVSEGQGRRAQRGVQDRRWLERGRLHTSASTAAAGRQLLQGGGSGEDRELGSGAWVWERQRVRLRGLGLGGTES